MKSNNSTVSRSYDCTKAKGKNVETPKGGVFFCCKRDFISLSNWEKKREREQLSRDTAGHTRERWRERERRREEACTKINIKRKLNQKTDEN